MASVENRFTVAASDTRCLEDLRPPLVAQNRLPIQFLASERDFYSSYPWALNIYPTVEDAITYLRQELTKLDGAQEPWQLAEMMTNVFLLSCAVANEVDDYLVGKRYDFSKVARVPFGAVVVRAADRFVSYSQRIRELRLKGLKAWRERWQSEIDQYLEIFVCSGSESSRASLASTVQRTLVPKFQLPIDLLGRRLRNPAFFHGRDLTHFDVLKLGEKFVESFPDRRRPIVLVGLRTAGSFFAPLLRAYLKVNGYVDVDLLTVRPRSALGCYEKTHLTRCANEQRTAVIVDESPIGGGSTVGVVQTLQKMGYREDRIVALLPVHRLYRDWKKGWESLRGSKACALTLEPDEWHKQRMLAPEAVEGLFKEYFEGRGYLFLGLTHSSVVEDFNFQLKWYSDEKYHTRHKKIYKIHVRRTDGTVETRYVLAKSVGWGWLSYRAFILSERLSRFVPPVLGLRNGFLYTEWRPQPKLVTNQAKDGRLNDIACYVASRVRLAGLQDDPSADLIRDNQHTGFEELTNVLSRAYCSRTARLLKRPRMRRELCRRASPFPTLIDGKMRPMEWIWESTSLLKTDFEHHGMGKKELEVTDPAYDLAEAILHFNLSEAEEQKLIDRYIEESGDTGVGERMFLNKLLAGTWSMNQALANLKDTRLLHRSEESNQRYLDAWNFLTMHTIRVCASRCPRPRNPGWHSPIVVLDLDGVLDTHFLGFPSTTAAGIRAISLLHAHGFAVALDTARSLSEVKEYCRLYGFAGGVAEYGSSLWDAVNGRDRILVSPEALSQLDVLRHALRKLPGIFLNDAYQYSIRAYTYQREQTVALPTMLIQSLMASLNLDHLRFHQTDLDTAILAKVVDKGTGLAELINGLGEKDPMVIAIGDSEPDLPMFRVATRCFAPSHIWCRSEAMKLGCHIAAKPFQPGLLDIVRSLVHPNGDRCEQCRSCDRLRRQSDDLFFRLLEVADLKRIKILLRAMVDPLAIKAFAP